ncbi:hypothetical protein ACFY9S_38660 [Streptomyces sp. NPDC012474]|uniref:hypothetical protein n=1 Tax=Streptomyces sp. NPDC012474 TaxID=3364836 RepID=UPI0036E8D139
MASSRDTEGQHTRILATSVFTRALEVRSSQSVSGVAQIATDVNIINNAGALLPVPRARLEQQTPVS